MKTQPTTDHDILVLRTILSGRIRFLNTLITICGFLCVIIIFGYYYLSHDLGKTSNLATWIVPCSITTIAMLLVGRKLTAKNMPLTYSKPVPCRIYHIIYSQGFVTCYFIYQGYLQPQIVKITNRNVMKQIDKDVYSNLLIQVSVHCPDTLSLNIPLCKLTNHVARIECTRLENDKFRSFLRTTEVDAEPSTVINKLVSHNVDFILGKLSSKDSYDVVKIAEALSVLCSEKDSCYQQVYKQAGYRIASIKIISKT